MTNNDTTSAAVQFFTEHAGYSYDPARQSEADGQRETAEKLAKAETAGIEAGLSFVWSIDQHSDSSEWSDDPDPWHVWQVVTMDSDGDMVGALGGVDFGRDGSPYASDYRRVVEAEQAAEYLADDSDLSAYAGDAFGRS